MTNQIIRMAPVGIVDVAVGAQPYGARDAQGGGAFGSELRLYGGTDNVNGVFKTQVQSINLGYSFLQISDVPFAAANEFAIAQHDKNFATPRLFRWGGKTSSGMLLDSWYCDATGWHQITNAMVGFVNQGVFYKGAYCPNDKIFYNVSGEEGDGSIIKSIDLINWYPHAVVPNEMIGYGRFSFAIFQGVWYMSGTELSVAKLWKSTNKGQTWVVVSTDNIFGDMWSDMAACDNFLVYQRGGKEGFNQKGTYYLTDTATNVFTRFNYEHEPTHATTLFPTADRKGIYLAAGNFNPTVWLVKNVLMR